ncbi:MAG: mechanosensitive ion channel, partial [marine benthic group bacterium]|nr:mechanosensitive ion channel [Gemmatimonadota bacterium]
GLERTRSEVAEILQGTSAILDNLDHLSVADMRASDLSRFRQSLERQKDRLEARTSSLERRLETLEREQLELTRIQRQWELTRDSISADTMSTSAFETGIDRMLARVDSTSAGLDSLLLEFLDIGESVAGVGVRLDTALDAIREAQATKRRMLLVPDSPPIWRLAAVLNSDDHPILGDVAAYLAGDARAFRDSLPADRTRVLLHLLIFLLALGSFLWLSRKSDTWSEAEELAAIRHIVSRPYSAAALTALLATNWVYPHPSFLVLDVALILTLIPVSRLLPPLVLEERKSSLYGLFALFLASRLTVLLPPESLAERLAFLCLAIAAATWSALLLRSLRDGEGTLVQGRWHAVLVGALRIGLVLSVLAVLLNLAGWVDLSDVLIQGLIPAGYVAIVLTLAAMMLVGITRALAAGPTLNRSKAFQENRDRIVRLASGAIRALAILVWLWSAFALFGLDQELVGQLRGILTHEFSIGAVDISIGGVLLFLLILWLATWLGRIVRTVLRDDVLAGLSIPPGQADAWSTLAQWAILLAGILFAAASAGIGGGQLAVLAGALGVGIGFGLQNIVNNFVSGFILIFEQPIKAGDKVEVSSLGLLGEVRRIGIRSSTIRTFDGADVVVPNSNLIQSEVVNWTLSDSKRRFQVEVGVKYGTDPQRVIDLLLEVAAEHPRVLKYPTPTALFMGFGDSSLNFRLNIWSATFEDFFALRSEVNVLVNERLKAEGIEIPFPQRDLHLRSVAPRAGSAISGKPESPADGAETAADRTDGKTSDD